MRNFSFFFGVLILLVPDKCLSQAPAFENDNGALISINPSFAGTNGLFRTQANYWHYLPRYASNFYSNFNSADVYIKPSRTGIAFSALKDNWGISSYRLNYSISLAQHFLLLHNKLKLIPSLQVGYGVYSTNISWCGTPPVTFSKSTYLSLGTGLLFVYKNLYAGISAANLNQPRAGFLLPEKIPVSITYHASYNMHIGETSLINFSARIAKQQKFSGIILGINTLINRNYIIGLFYTAEDAVHFKGGYKGAFFNVQAGYNLLTSPVERYRYSYDLTAAFNLRPKEKRKLVTNFEEW
jgi:type IX secretion system PorP/SprF family membrane protein